MGSVHFPTSCVLPSSIDQNTSQGEVRYDNNDNIDNDNSCHRCGDSCGSRKLSKTCWETYIPIPHTTRYRLCSKCGEPIYA